MNNDTILVFDQAQTIGGSIMRMVDVANNLKNYNFIFACYTDMSRLKINSNIIVKKIYSFWDYKKKINHIKYIKSKNIKYEFMLLYIVKKIFALIDVSNNLFVTLQVLIVCLFYKVSVVQANSNFHFLPYNIAKLIDKPLVVFMRSKDFFDGWCLNKIYSHSKYVFVSYALYNYYNHIYNFEKKKSIIIYDPVDVDSKIVFFRQNSLFLENFNFVCNFNAVHVGRICKQKGQMDALRVLNMLLNKGYLMNIIFIGAVDMDIESSDYYNQMIQYIDNNNLNNYVSFLGFRDDVLDIVQKSNIFLHTATDFEGLGGAIIEAMQLGKIVIASDIGGPSEYIINGVNGFLYNSRCLHELLEILMAIIDKKVDLGAISDHAKRYSRDKFATQKICNDIMHVYISLTNRVMY